MARYLKKTKAISEKLPERLRNLFFKKEKKEKTKSKKLAFAKLSMKERIFFAKRLSFLLRAGIPTLESLHMIVEQTNSKKYSRMVETMAQDVSNGQYLSKALEKFKKSFGELAINIIYVGETTGTLSENLEYLAEELKKKYALRKKVVGAFIYPAIVTVATIAITSFLIVFLFPKLLPVFSSLNVALPISTKIMIALSVFLKDYGLLIMGLIFLVSALFPITLKKSKRLRFFYDKTVLKIPIAGKIIQYYNLANITRTLGLLLKSGVSLSEALPMTAKTTGNTVYKREIEKLKETVERGEKISSHLKKNKKIFPEVLSQIIAVGEKSGNLSNSLTYLSELYESEVDDLTKNISNMIEPILMIFMGLMVGFVAISIIIPIYGITQNLQP